MKTTSLRRSGGVDAMTDSRASLRVATRMGLAAPVAGTASLRRTTCAVGPNSTARKSGVEAR